MFSSHSFFDYISISFIFSVSPLFACFHSYSEIFFPIRAVGFFLFCFLTRWYSLELLLLHFSCSAINWFNHSILRRFSSFVLCFIFFLYPSVLLQTWVYPSHFRLIFFFYCQLAFTVKPVCPLLVIIPSCCLFCFYHTLLDILQCYIYTYYQFLFYFSK